MTTPPPLPTHIGNRPLSLAGHLRTTAAHVQSGRLPYLFTYGHVCNVGCFARVATGLDAYSLAAELDRYYTPLRAITGNQRSWENWATTALNAIPLDGGTAKGVVGQLQQAGLLLGDFDHLEHLSHPELVCPWQTPEDKRHYEIAANYVAYLLKWAQVIETFNALNRAAPTEATMEALEQRPLVGVAS